MFALKPWSKTVTRVVLVAVMAFNALPPAAVSAMSTPKNEEVESAIPVVPLTENERKGSAGSSPLSSLPSSAGFQDSTPTVEPVETSSEPFTSEPSATPTMVTESVSTASAAVETTPTPGSTATQTTSVTATSQPPGLSFQFLVTPEQAAPGAEVTFSIKIINNGQTSATGLLFSNILPLHFGNAQNGFKDFTFDPKTRLLTWNGAQAGVPTLAPGQKLDLTYTARLETQLDEMQIVDTATLSADGLSGPIPAEATLTLLASEKRLTMLDAKEGKAPGLNNRVQVNLPKNALNTARGVLIRDLSETLPSPTIDQPWLMFELEMRVPKPEKAQSLLAGSVEQDRIIPMEPVEPQFDQPVEIVVSLDGFADLSTLEADKAPFLVTLDEASNTWVRVPLKSIDPTTNQVTAEVNHFSIWGLGMGSTTPQNGANVLLFDNEYSDLFTGRVRYSLPIWTPPGRNGMAPSLALSYSSSTANGILGDVQAPWVGMGWNIDTIEIARKITNGGCSPCGGGSYGYENKFLLLINGVGYELLQDGSTPSRYHTKNESFLYIIRHNPNLGNNSPAATNTTSEWWEVVQKDGTRWRLGWTTGSEQLAAMKGYPGAATGTWATLGYAGNASNVVTFRWRADQVKDRHDNLMTFTYFEETRPVAGTSANYDRASYMDAISYTGHTSGTPAAGYSVAFVRESRGTNEVPTAPTDWDHWDTFRLDRIEAKYGTTVVRTYDLTYQVGAYSDGSPLVNWQTTKLSSVAVSGGSTTAPTMTFSYADKENRAPSGAGSNEWHYPRLETIANGWGGTSTFAYVNDGRPSTSWYNWRADSLTVSDGIAGNLPMRTRYSYGNACYKVINPPANWTCNSTNPGELVGYDQVTASTRNFADNANLAIAVNKFHTDEQKAGREYEVLRQDAASTTLSKSIITYTVETAGFPSGGFFTYASQVDEYLLAATLDRINRTEYIYSSTTGNLTTRKEYNGALTLYRQTAYQYVTNTSASVWILDKVARSILQDGSLGVIAQQEFGYDGSLPASGSPTLGELTLSRQVNGSATQTIDTKYLYDTYGNVTETRQYKTYGTTGTQPSGTYLSFLTTYDTALKTYVTSSDPPLLPATATGYDFGVGLPITVTDPNGNMTTTTYDGLGRIKSVTYPGSAQQDIKYTYPTPPVSAPYAFKVEIWDQTASTYRLASQIKDGLGRVIQTQSPYETAGMLILNDTSYDAQGLVFQQGLPRTLTGTGGSYFAPNWGSIPETVTTYDALGRISRVTYPDATSSQEKYDYSGLRITLTDRNNHRKVQEKDGFGRLVKVEEYTGSGPYTLYATTNYQYDVRDLFKQVTDAASNVITINYDGYGRKIETTDPDLGNWRYRYNALNNLTAQIDARRRAVNLFYDDLNRLKGKTVAGSVNADTYQPPADPGYGSYSTKYYYDAGANGFGHRTSMVDASGTTTWTYNALGQIANETRNIESTPYSIGATYDVLGRPLTITLPSSEVLNYGYNAMGALSSLSGTSTYVSQIHYEPSGQVKDQLLGDPGNNFRQQYCYEAGTLRLSAIRVYSGTWQNCNLAPSTPRLNFTYTYQPNGNISQWTDVTRSEAHIYTYDEVDRLQSVSGPAPQSFTQNTIGNTVTNSSSALSLNSADAGGFQTSCSLTTSGGASCWGGNGNGALGNGGGPDSLTPVSVSGLTNVTAITVGGFHACALLSSGGVKCWGYNIYGQVGDGATLPSPSRNAPVNVTGLTSGVAAISAGSYHTCALLTTGGVKCWGYNNYGQLGNNSTTNSSTPVNVNGLSSGVIAISAGGQHTCALLSGGTVKCWGWNFAGQLGDGTVLQSNIPVSVSGLSNVSAISAGGYHSCALLTTGGAKCWGYNPYGQIGDGGAPSNRLTPVNVTNLTSGVTSISAGDFHTCALVTGGAVKCWGWNTYGEVGDNTNTQRNTPVDVNGLTSGVNKISAGIDHTCASLTGGGVKCWGRNDVGDLGNGTTTHSSVPVTVLTPSSFSYTSSAHVHAVTSLSTGETYTYDANGNMTCRVEGGITYKQVYNSENLLTDVQKMNGTCSSGTVLETTSFVYDGDGELVKKIKPDGSKTIYVGGVYEVDKSSGGSVTRTVTYYPAAGAMRINSDLYYILKDHLGSAVAVTNASGVTVGEQRYYSYGEIRFTTGTMFTDRLYTGQRQIAGLGIYHYEARFYSPKLGRFLSADSIVPGYANPQNLNRFAYVVNNPVRYTDSTGHGVDCGIGTNCVTKPGTPGVAPNPATYKCYICSEPRRTNNRDERGGSNPENMDASDKIKETIKYWEAGPLPPSQYPEPDIAEKCTIGYGHTFWNPRRPDGKGCSREVKDWYAAHPLPYTGPEGTESAESFLQSDIHKMELVIERNIKADLTQAQFDALVSYIFNVGEGKLIEKKIPELINSGNYEEAAAAIASGPITSGGQELDILKERRKAEAHLFLTGDYGNYVPWSPP